MRQILPALLCAVMLALPNLAAAQRIAHDGLPTTVMLNPLKTGLSAVTLGWPTSKMHPDDLIVAQASLEAILRGPTRARTAYEQHRYLRLNGIQYGITQTPEHMLLTLVAPADGFSLALDYLDEAFRTQSPEPALFQRALINRRPLSSTIHRRPEAMASVLVRRLYMPGSGAEVSLGSAPFRFGRPAHVVLRSEDKSQITRVGQVVSALEPGRNTPVRTAPEPAGFALPTGVIHLPDPGATETLIMLVKAQSFADYDSQVGAHLLVDYIGAHQGSEMFRIIRQDMRAAYAPKSSFTVTGKHQALITLSATVDAAEWPQVLDTVEAIYERARGGEVDLQGLANVQRRLLNTHVNNFWTDPIWGAVNYLREYPQGTKGAIKLPLLNAIQAAKPEEVAGQAASLLPELADFLLIVIGGGTAPDATLRAQGYCALDINAPLRDCLGTLAAR